MAHFKDLPSILNIRLKFTPKTNLSKVKLISDFPSVFLSLKRMCVKKTISITSGSSSYVLLTAQEE